MKKPTEKQLERKKLIDFFLSIWKERKPHKCYNCGKRLGKEPLSYYFDHILEKYKFPHLKYEKDNICYLCFECHDNKTRGFLSDKLKKLVEITKKLYGIL